MAEICEQCSHKRFLPVVAGASLIVSTHYHLQMKVFENQKQELEGVFIALRHKGSRVADALMPWGPGNGVFLCLEDIKA